ARAFEQELPARLGTCWLAALEGIHRGRIDFLSYRMLDTVDGDSRIPQTTQRQEHLEMFVLLGDPALRLPQFAEDIALNPIAEVKPGETITLRGRVPERLHGASLRVQV